MTNKIDKKITLLWNDIRDLCQTRKLMTKKRSYWYKPYRMQLGKNLSDRIKAMKNKEKTREQKIAERLAYNQQAQSVN